MLELDWAGPRKEREGRRMILKLWGRQDNCSRYANKERVL